MKKLIICEKPSLALNVINSIGKMTKKDGYYENDNYMVTFAFGHLLRLYDIDDYFNRERTKWNLDELPFVPGQFLFKLKNDSGCKKQYSIIKQLILRDDVEEIINCGDADREGEVIINNIIYNIFSELGIKRKITRLWLPDQTKETICKQLKDCKNIDNTKNLYNEGLARTYIDWLFGINLTRYMTIKSNCMFPVGRVLVPIVQFVYDRDMLIKNFMPKDYYVINTTIMKDNKQLKLSFDSLKFDDNSNESHQKALELIQKLEHENIFVESISSKEMIKQSPKLFSLDTLQNYLFKNYKMPLSTTLKIVQALYEKGLVTYPRTNTEYLSTNEKDKVKEILSLLNDYNLTFKDKSSIFDDSKIESHSAIIITTKLASLPVFSSKEEETVYNSILNRFKAVFCKDDTIIQETKVCFRFATFHAYLKGNSIMQEGFLKFEPTKDHILPNFREGETFEPNLKLEINTTTPPQKVTEAELNSYLKNPFRKVPSNKLEDNAIDESASSSTDEEIYKDILRGIEIGTVATRSSIIENAVKYEYIIKSKNSLSISPKGESLINNLKQLDINLDVNKTVEISQLLKQIYKNEISIDNIIDVVVKELKMYTSSNKNIEKYTKNKEFIGECPKCGRNVVENSKSFYCEDYKN